MKYILACVTENILWFGLFVSIYYGLFAHRIFWTKEQVQLNFGGKYGIYQRIHQIWLNFVSALVGWFSIYIFLEILLSIQPSQLSITHILLLGFGIIGVVGWLPRTLWSIATSINESMNKILRASFGSN